MEVGDGGSPFHLSVQNEISMTSECYNTTCIHLVVKLRSKKHIKALWKKQAIIQSPTKHFPTPTHPIILLEPGPRCDVPATAFLVTPQHAQAALCYLTFEISLQKNPTKARLDFTHELLTRLSVTHTHTNTHRERHRANTPGLLPTET